LFNPFNEANKAFLYLILKGDIILDVWSIEYITACWIISEQKIISIWEGDTDALGYNGFFVLVLK
jgi:hypothetical protein